MQAIAQSDKLNDVHVNICQHVLGFLLEDIKVKIIYN